MIQLPRSFFRQLRTILRRTFGKVQAFIDFQSGPGGLVIQCQQEGIGVLYQTHDRQSTEHVVLPAQALADIDGKGHDVVTLEVKNTSKVQVRWNDAGVPRTLEYDSPKPNALTAFPEMSRSFTAQDPSLVKALDDAMQSASNDSVRFALNKIQIRGGTGVITATDGHTLLWQNGFQFPWSEDVLVPRTNVFGCKELSVTVSIAKTKTHICVQVEPWTILLPIDKESRFPRVETIIPSNLTSATHVTLTPENSAFLTTALPRLPGDDDDLSPVTLDLNGEVVIRARAEGQEQSTEVVLAGANVTGKAIRFATNRQHLTRALQLGFTEAHILGAETPMLFQDQRRKYVVQGLGKDRIIAPSNNDVRLRSDSSESNNHHPPATRRNEPMRSSRQPSPPIPAAPAFDPPPVAENNGNGTSNSQHSQHGTFAALLEEGQSIQNALRDLLLRTNRLMVGLKAYRRHAKTMQSTLASLRQLQQVEA